MMRQTDIFDYLKINSGRFKKGCIPWNKGLTKETDDRVRKNGENASKSIMNNEKERKRRSERMKGEKNPMYGSDQSGKNNPMFGVRKYGKDAPYWRGGKIKTDKGYIKIKKRNHSKGGKNNYVHEHILVMEEYLGRLLIGKERVHHINGVRDDNRIENLCLCENISEHHGIVHKSLKKLSYELVKLNVIGFDREKKEYYINQDKIKP